MKKQLVVTGLVLSLTFTTGMSVTHAENANAVTEHDKDKLFAEQTQRMEDRIYSEELELANKEIESLIKRNQVNKLDQTDLKEKIKKIKKDRLVKAQQRARDYKLKSGWVEVTQPTNQFGDVSIESSPSNITLTDEILFNSSTGQFQFSGNLSVTDISGWDYNGDTIDLMSIRSNNPVTIVSSYARVNRVSAEYAGSTLTSYTSLESGYDNNGTTYSGSKVSKRAENNNGVMWNVQDGGVEWYYDAYSGKSYDTDNGRVTMYFKKPSGSTNNKIFMDYEHNWKSYSWSGSATLAGVNLTGSSLSVTYSSVNYNFQRTSTGKTF